jgi:uncharacterized membrane protein
LNAANAPRKPHPAVAALTALLLCAVVAQGLGALAAPSWNPALAQWGTVAIPVMVVLLGLSVLLRLDVMWNCAPVPLLARAVSRRHAMLATTVVATLVYFAWALQRHRAYQTQSFDLGCWHQVIWNTGHGHPFITSLMTLEDEYWLAWHFTLTLALFSPLTWFTDSAWVILLAQSALLAAGAIPIHRMAVKRLGDGALAWLMAVAFLMSPLVRGANGYEFHEIALSTACMAWALHFFDEKRHAWALLPILLGALTKESTALCTAGMAISLGLGRVTGRERAGFAVLAAAMLAWFFLAMTVVTPAMGQLSGEFFYLFRYENLGHGVGEIVTNLLTHPWRFLTVPFETPEKAFYFVKTVGPFVFLPLLSPRGLVAAAPTYLMNTLGVYHPMHSVSFHYGAEMSPALALAAIQGAHTLLSWRAARGAPVAQSRRNLGYAVVACSLALYGPSELARARLVPRTAQHEAWDALLARIPPDAPVSCGSALCAHLSGRRQVFMFPRVTGREDTPGGRLIRKDDAAAAGHLVRAQYVVVDAARPQPGYWWPTEKYQPAINGLAEQGYVPVDASGSVTLYQLKNP